MLPSYLKESYKLIEPLAQGGQSHIYICENLKTKKLIILKVYKEDFLNGEDLFQKVKKLKHPAILKPMQFFKEKPNATEFPIVRGGTLYQRIIKKLLNIHEVGVMLAQFVSILHSFADQDLVHRDLKPDNIFIDNQNSYFISDFDLAYFKEGFLKHLFLKKQFCNQGTAYYMAPEHLLGQRPHFLMDHYAMATTVYQCLTNKLPFGNELQKKFALKNFIKIDSLTSKQNQALALALHPKAQKRITIYELYERLFF